jgi:hypothetical protein
VRYLAAVRGGYAHNRFKVTQRQGGHDEIGI